MENRNVKKYLYDIKQAIDSINEYLGDNRDFFKYQENKQLRRAVERELEIIGEAVNKALLIEPELVSSIQDARRIVDLRNYVIHGYDKIDDVIGHALGMERVSKSPDGDARIATDMYMCKMESNTTVKKMP